MKCSLWNSGESHAQMQTTHIEHVFVLASEKCQLQQLLELEVIFLYVKFSCYKLSSSQNDDNKSIPDYSKTSLVHHCRHSSQCHDKVQWFTEHVIANQRFLPLKLLYILLLHKISLLNKYIWKQFVKLPSLAVKFQIQECTYNCINEAGPTLETYFQASAQKLVVI